jgi:hypothetical protein
MTPLLALLSLSFLPPGTSGAVQTQPALPSLVMIGAEYGTSTNPHYSGFLSIALPVSQPLGLYSYSLYQGLIINKKLVTSTTTGGADDLKTFCFKPGCAVLVGLETAGVSTGTSTSLALSGGGGLLFRWNNGWVVAAFGVQNLAAGVSKPSILAGVGRTW